MKIQTFLLCTALTMTLGSYTAHAETSGPRYVPRAEISEKNATPTTRWEDYSDKESYQAYEEREPCQNYRAEPRNYDAGCVVDKPILATVQKTVAKTETQTEPRPSPIIQSYTLLFDHDKSEVRADETATLNQITQEINKYDPSAVTITGYTDSSGKSDYNQDLSRDRERAVSAALLERGIQNHTLEREARGEYDQAVQTADGTKNQENRRVVVDFRR